MSSEWFIIRSKYSGLVLDITGGKHGANIQTFGEHGGDNQLWRWNGKCVLSKLGYVLDIDGGNTEKGTKVIAWNQNGGKNQQWRMEGDKIVSDLNGMCLDIYDASKSSNVQINMWPVKSDNQSWELI